MSKIIRSGIALTAVGAALLGLTACGPSVEEACPLSEATITGIVGLPYDEQPGVHDRSGDGLYGGASRPECDYSFALDPADTGLSSVSFESVDAKGAAGYKDEYLAPFDGAEFVPEWGDTGWIQIDLLGQLTAKFEAGGRFWRMDVPTATSYEDPDSQEAALQTAKDIVSAVIAQLG